MTTPTRISDIQNLCVFDLETTGVDVHEDRIVTSFIGRVTRSGEVNGSYSWLVNPGVPIAPGATAVHGITDEMAQADGVDAASAVSEMLTVLRRSIAAGRPIVAYNAAFDLSMLNAEARRYGLEPIDDFGPVIDPFVIDKAIDKYRKGGRKLTDTAVHYGVELVGAHDAEADAVATGRVCWAVLAKTEDYELSVLHERQVVWARESAASLQTFLRRKVTVEIVDGVEVRRQDPTITIDGTWPLRSAAVPKAAVEPVTASFIDQVPPTADEEFPPELPY